MAFGQMIQTRRLMMAFSQQVFSRVVFLGKLLLVASPGYDEHGFGRQIDDIIASPRHLSRACNNNQNAYCS